MANRLRITEGMRSFNRTAKAAGMEKMTLERLAPLVFGENEEIAPATGRNYLSQWDHTCDAEEGKKLTRPHPKHIVRIARALNVTADDLLEE